MGSAPLPGSADSPGAIVALPEDIDITVETRQGRTAGWKLAGGWFLVLSVGLHAAFFAVLFLREGQVLPGAPERQSLRVSWVSISRDTAPAAAPVGASADRTKAKGYRPLQPPEAAEQEASPTRLPSEPVLSPAEPEREANPLPAAAVPDEEKGTGGFVALPGREGPAPEGAQGVTLAAKPRAPGPAVADGTRAADGLNPPRYLENRRPDYPAIARLRGYEGVVWLSVEVSPEGRVGDLRIKKSSGFDILDQSAIRAVRTWRFEPARSMGNPVSMWVDLPIRFVLTGSALAS